MTDGLTVSVIICTRNRADTLEACLRSLESQKPGANEILVIDNASEDCTEALIASLAESVAHLRYVREETIGLSHARNRGLREARFAVVAYIDDDATAEPNWIRAILEAMQDPSVACIGGRITVGYPETRPAWLDRSFDAYLGYFDLGKSVCTTTEIRGGNFAVRRDIGLSVGGFDPALGYVDQALIGGEEVEFARRIRNAGGAVLYVPGASVVHHVSEDRLNKSWFFRRTRGQGVANARAMPDRYTAGRAVRKLGDAWGEALYARIRRNEVGAFRMACQSSSAQGVLDTSCRNRRALRIFCYIGAALLSIAVFLRRLLIAGFARMQRTVRGR
ncbi:MAG: glycosyltransferase [Chthonomonadales bacterium]|nr:glycosyltransferase [Chthonomonadales bacterium]